MKSCSLTKIIFISLFVYFLHSQLTLPLKLKTLSQSQFQELGKYHQLHRIHTQLSQTYRLRTRQSFFTLELKFNELVYQLNVDTGSSDLFIKGDGTSGQPQEKFKCQDCVQNNKKYKIGYLDGFLDTYQTQVQVQLGQHKFNQSILVAYQIENKNFDKSGGILGLSYPQIAQNPNPTFLQTLINNKYINQYAFGVNLNFKNKQTNFITLGTYDKKFFQGELKMYNITARKQYRIVSKGVKIGDGQELPIDDALFDTGNTCISIPRRYQTQILSSFSKKNDQGVQENKCYFEVQQYAPLFSLLKCRITNFNALPDIKILIEDQQYIVTKQFYMDRCGKIQRDNGAWYCTSYIESVGRQDLFLGDSFFNRFYTYFDLSVHKIGVAQNKETVSVDEILLGNSRMSQKDFQPLVPREDSQQSQEEHYQKLRRSTLEKTHKA